MNTNTRNRLKVQVKTMISIIWTTPKYLHGEAYASAEAEYFALDYVVAKGDKGGTVVGVLASHQSFCHREMALPP